VGEGHPVWIDPGFDDLVSRHPELAAVRRYLPATAAAQAFEGQGDLDPLQPSYAARGYGSLLYALIRVLKPLRAVELGVFQGYSLLSAAAALRDNGAGAISGYDLFEAYPYRHAQRDQVSRQILASGLKRWATVHQDDAAGVHERWDTVDYLHVDLSNDGDTYRRVFAQWSGKVRQVILLEGGSRERDNVEWMHNYGKLAILPAIVDLRHAHPGWSFTVLQPFPSWTIACNRAAFK
jgi:hypothetical protein